MNEMIKIDYFRVIQILRRNRNRLYIKAGFSKIYLFPPLLLIVIILVKGSFQSRAEILMKLTRLTANKKGGNGETGGRKCGNERLLNERVDSRWREWHIFLVAMRINGWYTQWRGSYSLSLRESPLYFSPHFASPPREVYTTVPRKLLAFYYILLSLSLIKR